ncbi:MAG: AAA family ATPase [Planctomycetes bacterium]|nr:AAA family ATPase [Planctomycetota bacterium]
MIGKAIRAEGVDRTRGRRTNKQIAADIVQQFTETYRYVSGPFGTAARAISFVRESYKLIKNGSTSDSFHFLSDNFNICDLPGMFLAPILRGVEPTELDMFRGNFYTILVYDLGDFSLYIQGHREESQKPKPRGPFFFKEPPEEFQAKFSEYLYKRYGETFEIRSVGHEQIEYVTLEGAQDYIGPYDASYFDEYLSAFESKGMDRVLLFIGKPGTGKTTMARRIADLRGRRCVVAHIHMLVPLAEKVITYFKPGVLVMDDLHLLGSYGTDHVLHFLENIQSKLKGSVLIGTASRVISIDEGAHRPGRFDDIFHFQIPDVTTMLKIMHFYAKKYGCVGRYEQLEPFLKKECVGLPPAYLKSVVQNIYALSEVGDLEDRLRQKIELAKKMTAADRSEFDHSGMVMGGMAGRDDRPTVGLGFRPGLGGPA